MANPIPTRAKAIAPDLSFEPSTFASEATVAFGAVIPSTAARVALLEATSGVKLRVGVGVLAGIGVGINFIGMGVGVGVGVLVGVDARVGVGVSVGVGVFVGVGSGSLMVTAKLFVDQLTDEKLP